MPFHIVLHEPLIPSNTGNIARTCAATGIHLHLIHPLGFSTDDKYLKRAGLDYWDAVNIHHWDSFDDFAQAHKDKSDRFFFVETSGTKYYSEIKYEDGDFLIFGKETSGFPQELIERYPEQIIRIPMGGATRSMNLSNCAALVAFEALRQTGFSGLD